MRRTNSGSASSGIPAGGTPKADGPNGTQSLDRAIALLRIVAGYSGRGVRLVDVVERSGLSKPTVHRLLQALERQGLVTQDAADRHYHLGPEAFVIGTLANERYGIHRVALTSLVRLADASEDSCFLSVRRDMHVVCLHREEGAFPIRSHVLRPGDRHPLGVGAGSLAILSSLPDDEVDEVIGTNVAELTARYPEFSPPVLRSEIRRTREQGYALNQGLLQRGSWGVGVAVLDRQGRCEGALSIAAIDTRLMAPRGEEMARLLQAEARRLSERLARPASARQMVGSERKAKGAASSVAKATSRAMRNPSSGHGEGHAGAPVSYITNSNKGSVP
jgi:DNA-binding IclR family transcriptional regulator